MAKKDYGFNAWTALFLRLVPGIVFFFAGLGKFISGIGNVANFIVEGMKATFLPSGLVMVYAYILPFAELLLGLGFILGFQRKYVYPLGGILMLTLIFGVWIQQDYATTAQNVIHLFAILGAMRFAGADKLCLDKK